MSWAPPTKFCHMLNFFIYSFVIFHPTGGSMTNHTSPNKSISRFALLHRPHLQLVVPTVKMHCKFNVLPPHSFNAKCILSFMYSHIHLMYYSFHTLNHYIYSVNITMIAQNNNNNNNNNSNSNIIIIKSNI